MNDIKLNKYSNIKMYKVEISDSSDVFITLQNKTVINIQNGRRAKVGDLIKDQKNIFINYWFKGCIACELEMPDIEAFYKKYGHKINFIIVSNDKAEIVKKYVKNNNLKLPFFIFEDEMFPELINTFPTSYLIINRYNSFFHIGTGYFNTYEFYEYINDKLNEKSF